MKNKFLKNMGILAVAAVIFLLGAYVGKSFTPPESDQSGTVAREEARLMIDYGNGRVETFNDLSVATETDVSDLLEGTGVEIEYKDYGGDLGLFIQSIKGVGPDPEGDKWWQYWVNNEYAKVGVSQREVNPGDIIEFKFIEGQR